MLLLVPAERRAELEESQNFSNAQTSTAAATANNSNPLAQAFAALLQDPKNGNLSAAQKDYANMQQDFQQQQQQRSAKSIITITTAAASIAMKSRKR